VSYFGSMVATRLGRGLRLLLALIVVMMPGFRSVTPIHAAERHCQQSHDGSDHAQTSGCESTDACQDCATPSCHATSHCGLAPIGLLAASATTVRPDWLPALPTGPASALGSIAKDPPTHPPRA